MYTKTLHRVLNVAIILAVVLLATSLGQRYYLNNRGSPQTVSVPGVNFSRSDKTLLLFLQHDCGSCIDSLPFYRRIVERFQERSGVQLVLITPREPEFTRQFFQKEGLSFAVVLQGKSGLLGVRLSPTLILVDSKGTVHGSWIGQMSPQQENDLWAMLTY